ncbi:hypothetical protein [Nocardiopsis sp. LOL_012]|uniref:hypothetical protein n=1 Tax=Nocardiopsis sp. LOL_012 TaxID=3345409 RepID=UPI003A860691
MSSEDDDWTQWGGGPPEQSPREEESVYDREARTCDRCHARFDSPSDVTEHQRKGCRR